MAIIRYIFIYLGICDYFLSNFDDSLECLKKANSLDITNSENWLWLAKVYTAKGSFVMCNQCVNQYEVMVQRGYNSSTYSDLLTNLKQKKSTNLCEERLRLQLIERFQLQETN
jgi:hypothetical protein